MAKIFRRLIGCSTGAVAVVTAIALPLLLGFGSMGVEVGHWYLTQRQMQGAADAAAISAAAQYIRDQIASNGTSTSTTYQTVGQTYASANGFSIPTANVCLVPVSGPHNCDPVLALDSRSLGCTAPPCIVVEITQNTLTWLTTQRSVRPTGTVGTVSAIPTPTLLARSVVSVSLTLTSSTTGSSCILTLANARNSIQVRGGGDISANCGLLVDGGRAQNANATTCTDGTAPPCGGLGLAGGNATVHITKLTVAANTPGLAGSTCRTTPPQDPRCFLFTPPGTLLPTNGTAIFTGITTPDPFAGRTFTKPPGQVITGVTLAAANGYTGSSTFTVQGVAGIAPKFRATISATGISGIVIVDPGQYTPTANPVQVRDANGILIAASFNLTSGNCLPGAQLTTMISATPPVLPVPGRAYCSINVAVGAQKSLNFPTGIYYIEGGETGCAGLCVNAGTYTTDAAGVTFVLTNTAGGSTYAQYAFAGNNAVNFTAPQSNINADGTVCASGCANTTLGMLIFQDRNAPNTIALTTAGAVTSSNLAAGTTVNGMTGCGGNTCRTLTGTLYTPNQTANFGGNGQVNGTCFGVVSKYLDVNGTPTFQNGCLPGTTGGGGGSSVIGGTFKLAQ